MLNRLDARLHNPPLPAECYLQLAWLLPVRSCPPRVVQLASIGGSGAAQCGADCLWSTLVPRGLRVTYIVTGSGWREWGASWLAQGLRLGCAAQSALLLIPPAGAWVCLGAPAPWWGTCMPLEAPMPPPLVTWPGGLSPLSAPVAAFFAPLPGWIQAAALAQSPARALGPVLPCPGGGAQSLSRSHRCGACQCMTQISVQETQPRQRRAAVLGHS